MLDDITPVILTLNEAPNIGRCLESLRWAKDIVVVDSFSADETVAIARSRPAVRLFQRAFDNHAAQWQFAISETDIATEWILALDADYQLTEAGIAEIEAKRPTRDVAGYKARFVICMWGKPLRSSAYPPVTVLYRRSRARYVQDGHTQRIQVEGRVEELREVVKHDDRKPLISRLEAQKQYSRLEAAKLLKSHAGGLSLADRIRKLRVVAPVLMFPYWMIWKGAILDGLAGVYYALQRTLAEVMLSLYLIEHDLRERHENHTEKGNES